MKGRDLSICRLVIHLRSSAPGEAVESTLRMLKSGGTCSAFRSPWANVWSQICGSFHSLEEAFLYEILHWKGASLKTEKQEVTLKYSEVMKRGGQKLRADLSWNMFKWRRQSKKKKKLNQQKGFRHPHKCHFDHQALPQQEEIPWV